MRPPEWSINVRPGAVADVGACGADRMRVLVDAHQLGRRQTGNETYVRELLRGLRELPGLDLVAAVERGQSNSGVLAPPMSLRPVPHNGLARLLALALAARRVRADLLHAVYFLPPFPGRPTVVTIHDISFERHPEFFGRLSLLRDRLLIRDAARRATRVITVSETSRRDLIELWGVQPHRVVAIPNGVSPLFHPEDEASPPVDLRGRPLRVLAVGTLQPRKNLLGLLEAVRLVGRDVPIVLRAIGPDGFQADQIRARLGGVSQVQVVGYVPESQLAREYRWADLFVYPSLYEGFGLPVLEAMASGTPVVTSTAGSLPEVAGDAALLVDPLDATAIAGAIRRIAEDDQLRAELRERGVHRATQYSWARTASLHAAVYEEAVR